MGQSLARSIVLLFTLLYCSIVAISAPIVVGTNPSDGIVVPITPLFSHQMAIDLLLDSSYAMQSAKSVLDKIIQIIGSAPAITEYCIYTPVPTIAGKKFCNYNLAAAKLPNDLQLLKDARLLLSKAIQYQANLSSSDHVVLYGYFNSCRDDLESLITLLNSALNLNLGSSGDESSTEISLPPTPGYQVLPAPPTQANAKPSHCYNCTNVYDQYYNMKELHLILLTVFDDIECIKNSMPQSSPGNGN